MLGHMVNICLIFFKKLLNYFPEWLVSFHIPTTYSQCMRSSFSITLPAFGTVTIFHFAVFYKIRACNFRNKSLNKLLGQTGRNHPNFPYVSLFPWWSAVSEINEEHQSASRSYVLVSTGEWSPQKLTSRFFSHFY